MLLDNHSTSYALRHRRPVSYKSMNPRQTKPEILKTEDPQHKEIVGLLKNEKI